MTNDDQQPDIYSFPAKEEASSESAALDDALLDAVDGIAQSLRDDERSMREQERLRQQRQLLIFGAIFLAVIAIPLVLLSSPQASQNSVEEIATKVPRTRTPSAEITNAPRARTPRPQSPRPQSPRKDDKVQLNQPGQANTYGDPRLRSGYYTMLLPRGFKWQVKLLALDKKRYRLTSKHRNLNNLGFYELQGNLLVMVEPDDKRLTEFQWLITGNDSLELVAEPPARKTGATYLGTALTRNPESE
ncbi:MAG: hypothetical protein GXP24_11030 [Planctomycetes bacterium]|nr:hypothetical protein [Planctomycetota bacterium]